MNSINTSDYRTAQHRLYKCLCLGCTDVVNGARLLTEDDRQACFLHNAQAATELCLAVRTE